MGANRARISSITRIFAIAGIAVAVAIASFGDRALGSLSNSTRPPPGRCGDGGPIYRATPSPDGRWVAIERLTNDVGLSLVTLVEVATGKSRDSRVPGECVRNAWSEDGLLRVRSMDENNSVNWIDPTTLGTLRTTADRDWYEQGFATRGDGWSQMDVVKSERGRQQRRISWPEHDLVVELGADLNCRWQTTPTAGVVFYSHREGDEVVILRRELDSDRPRILARAEWKASWEPSPDAKRLAVASKQGVVVVDAESGERVTEILRAGSPEWVENSRWLAVVDQGDVVLHDLEQGSSRKLFEYKLQGGMQIFLLDGERILTQHQGNVLLFAKDSSTPRRLFSPIE